MQMEGSIAPWEIRKNATDSTDFNDFFINPAQPLELPSALRHWCTKACTQERSKSVLIRDNKRDVFCFLAS
jgi:hypothetical protein